ncbi:MAG: insulinase family protein [Alkalibacterium sp.]|nr:insulinase family protein [Alkalibacterium sp.]
MTFKKIETQDLPDIQSAGTLYAHEETGAQVLHLANDDQNKAFTIGFKTPPYNDNGIAHILEHSVLNGSEKYPSKEPFVELIKGSLNTFVNAMTFSDKTIYPVASTNQKDFMHLVGVYLDAVFSPKLYDDAQILEQEGWHYHLENPEDDLIYKGVVYNEMKGATASPESQLYDHLSSQLYPDTIYQYNSGGEPKAIPSLTQDEFLDFHKKYYHPSNSLTVLYGDIDTATVFNELESYFNGMGKEDAVDLTVAVPEPKATRFEETYSITDGDTPEGKDYLALGWHVLEPEDALDNYGMKVLDEILFGHNQAPLQKALLDAEIGGDIESDVADIGYPTAFVITAKYAEAKNIDRFNQVVTDTLTDIVEKGLDKDLIKAALNKIIFQTKEAVISEDNPRGVIYAINALSTWLYDKAPYDRLQFSKYLGELEELSEDGYFEKLIERKLLNNALRVEVVLKAEPGKSDKLEAKTLEKLQAYKAGLSDEEVQAIVEKTQDLITRQETPDRPEDLAKIPTLTREDLTTDEPDYPLEESAFFEDTHFYYSEQFTSGIDYISLYFDISDFKSEDYAALSLLSDLLGELDTDKYDATSLQTQIDTHTGGINGKVTIFEDQKGHLTPYFVLSGKALSEKLTELVDLMKDIVSTTQFDDQSEILKLIQSYISDFENRINFGAHVIAANRALSQVKPLSKLGEHLNGIDQFNYLKATRDELKAESESELSNGLSDMLDKLLNKRRLNAIYVGDRAQSEKVKQALTDAFAELPAADLGQPAVHEAGTKQNEAFVTAQDVNYVGLAADARGHLDFTGESQVLSTALRFDYLWNNVRVKGGAYGSLYLHRRNGNMALASYRDPNITKTLDIYKQVPAYVDTLALSESELLKYIIGTLSPLEQPKSAYKKGVTAFSRFKQGLTTQDIIRLKEEILATDSEKLSALKEPVEKVISESTVAVIGNKAQIEKEKELFDAVYDLY